MVGRWLGLAVAGLLPLLLTAQRECTMFKKEYCNMQLDKILMLDTNMVAADECQTACFERTNCTQFTYFDGAKSRCVLFNSCSEPVSSCKNCVSGPAWPRVAPCMGELQVQSLTKARPVPRELSPRTRGRKVGGSRRNGFQRSNGPTRPTAARQQAAPCSSCVPCTQCQDGREDFGANDEEEEEEEDPLPRRGLEDEFDEDEDDEVNIDDGLLDEVFEDLPGNSQAKNQPAPRSPSKGSGCSGGCYYCVMGGSNQEGPVSAITVMNVGTYRVPRSSPIAAFPPSMTQGSGRTFSVFSRSNLMTCTPGYYANTFAPASTFGHPASTFGFFNQRTFIPGSCNGYDFSSRQWNPTGGKMTTARQGGSTINVGSYIMSMGGFNAHGQPLQSVDIFDPRRAHIGWQSVPQWRFPRATRDQCTVVTRDPQLGPQVMVMGGLGEEHSVMKLVLGQNNWYSVPPMSFPRVQHGCTAVTLNGRPGVVVSGGVDGNQFNTTSVEFFDMNTHRWINLPGLSRGRRGHTMTTVEGKLAVMGGAAKINGGDTEYLDDVEIFDGRRWKRANYKLDQPRDGANIVKIPITTFSYSFGK